MLLDLFAGRISLLSFIFGLVALILSVTIHEFSHAFAADRLGDPTPRLQGRLSLDPTVHLDSTGSLMLLLFGFGWGKPVPINPVQIKKGRLGVAIVSLAGPLSNFIMAIAIGLAFRFDLVPLDRFVKELFRTMLFLNLGLGIFNLLPVGPLDGQKIIFGLLPAKWAYRFARIQGQNQLIWMMVFIFVLFNPIYMFVVRHFLQIVVGDRVFALLF
ncbi:MAG TPA: site-2 protease family protein [Candidatus Wirthbacteria bacterium]|nr:site-2 protease family protein [Candidatus Wirthbacteria bacterium]